MSLFFTYDLEGNLIEIDADPVFTSMERSPTVAAFPADLRGVMISIPAKDGKPRLAFAPLSLFGTGENLTKLTTRVAKKPDWADLGTVILAETTPAARGNGVSSIDVACQLAEVGDGLLVTPVGKLPAGFMIGTATCQTAGTIQVPVFHPAQDAQATFSFTCAVVAFRKEVVTP
uniref:Uncharacterized protein n=1 Tax=Pseudomonas phage Arace01 TaxID=3138526 RepID=A0AAU6VZE2_9VIRU